MVLSGLEDICLTLSAACHNYLLFYFCQLFEDIDTAQMLSLTEPWT